MRTNTQLTIAATLVLAMAFTFNACSSSDDEGGGGGSSFSDKGNNIANYKTVKIGEQTWMAENLNYAVEGSKCFGEGGEVKVEVGRDENEEPIYSTSTLSVSEIQANCNKYGRLYTWEQAMRACPSGWHLPSNAEWTTLINYAGGTRIAREKLKAKNGWSNGDNGTDEYGFSALPGGYGYSGDFYRAGNGGCWLSTTENGRDSNFVYILHMFYTNDHIGWDDDVSKDDDFTSVRCVKD